MSWFTPKCPVDLDTKDWIENAFNWLIEELGPEVLGAVEVALPTEDSFPDPYDGSRSSVRRMVERVCGFMDVDPSSLELQFFENEEDASRLHPLAADGGSRAHDLGTYQVRRDGKYLIRLCLDQSRNPEMMVATIAHELGHVILLGEGRLDPEHPDHEPMTDLLTVFYGLGVFSANTAIVFEQWTNAQFQGWQIGGGGYLTEEMFGYALALFAYARGESKPEWSSYLKINVRSYFKSGLKYIVKTGNTSVNRLSAGRGSDDPRIVSA